METKFTPGPLEFIPNRIIRRENGQAVEVCSFGQIDLLDDSETDRIESFGRLFAAAPDLLSACELAVNQVYGMVNRDIIMAAIRKAKGER